MKRWVGNVLESRWACPSAWGGQDRRVRVPCRAWRPGLMGGCDRSVDGSGGMAVGQQLTVHAGEGNDGDRDHESKNDVACNLATLFHASQYMHKAIPAGRSCCSRRLANCAKEQRLPLRSASILRMRGSRGATASLQLRSQEGAAAMADCLEHLAGEPR